MRYLNLNSDPNLKLKHFNSHFTGKNRFTVKKKSSKDKVKNKSSNNKKVKSPNLYSSAKNIKSKESEKIHIESESTMENSNKIRGIISKSTKSLMDCPTGITKEMLLIELDCEDLRSRKEKETKESLWSTYREINSNIFTDRPSPSDEELHELKELIKKIRE
jgi:hypothetical protein